MRAQFGGGIDPRLGLIDYSGIARAAEIRARNNLMREEDEERKRQEKMKAVGTIIQTLKQKSDENKKLDAYADDLYRKIGSEDTADQRQLQFFGINEGIFGDQTDEEKRETIKNTLKSLGVEAVTDLENARKLSELKLSQDKEREQALYDAFKASQGVDNGETFVKDTEAVKTKIEAIENNRNLSFLDDDVQNKVAEITSKSPKEVTEEDLAVLNTIENQLKVIPRKSSTGAMGVIADLPSNMLGLIGDIPAEILNLGRPEDQKYRTQFTPKGEVPVVGGSDFFRQLPRYTVEPAKSLYNYLGFK